MKRNPSIQTYLSLWADRLDDMAEGHESNQNSQGKQLRHLASECRRVVARNIRGKITTPTVSRFLKDMAAKLDDMCEEHSNRHGVVGNIKILDNISNASRRMASQLDLGKTHLYPQHFEDAELTTTMISLLMGSLHDLVTE